MNTLASRFGQTLIALTLAALIAACAPITNRFGDLNWQPAVSDSDADGVPDFADKCPDSKPGVAVNSDGCPVVPTRCAEDFLNPGSPLFNCNPKLADAQPKAANRMSSDLGGEVVDVMPIRSTPIFEAPPANSPYTPRRLTESEIRPLIAGKPAIAASVNFEFGKTDLTPKQIGSLAKLATYLKKNPQAAAVIYAHSQDSGLFGNGGLTTRRIDSVAERLINFNNIDKSRLSFGVLPLDQTGRKNAGPDNKIHVLVPSPAPQSPLTKTPPPTVRPSAPPGTFPPDPLNAATPGAGQTNATGQPVGNGDAENATREQPSLPVNLE